MGKRIQISDCVCGLASLRVKLHFLSRPLLGVFQQHATLFFWQHTYFQYLADAVKKTVKRLILPDESKMCLIKVLKKKNQPPAGLEPAIPGLGGRCLIHWATEAVGIDVFVVTIKGVNEKNIEMWHWDLTFSVLQLEVLGTTDLTCSYLGRIRGWFVVIYM